MTGGSDAMLRTSSAVLRPLVTASTICRHSSAITSRKACPSSAEATAGVAVQITLNVARSEDEADRQARGEDVTVVREEGVELETFNPEALFEDEALARQRSEDEKEPDAE